MCSSPPGTFADRGAAGPAQAGVLGGLPDRTEQSCTPTVRLNPPCVNRVVGDANLEETIAARSRHPTGVNAAMCDGSVHFVSNNVDFFNVYLVTMTRAGGEPSSGQASNN